MAARRLESSTRHQMPDMRVSSVPPANGLLGPCSSAPIHRANVATKRVDKWRIAETACERCNAQQRARSSVSSPFFAVPKDGSPLTCCSVGPTQPPLRTVLQASGARQLPGTLQSLRHFILSELAYSEIDTLPNYHIVII